MAVTASTAKGYAGSELQKLCGIPPTGIVADVPFVHMMLKQTASHKFVLLADFISLAFLKYNKTGVVHITPVLLEFH